MPCKSRKRYRFNPFARNSEIAPRKSGAALSVAMLEALDTIEHRSLQKWRTGWGPGVHGPFVPFGTMDALFARGLADQARGYAFITREGITALAAWDRSADAETLRQMAAGFAA